jgi:hypothetical protein
MSRVVKKDGDSPAKAAVQEKKSFSIASYKQNSGLSDTTKEKPLRYMRLGGALPNTYPIHEATGVPGPAIGYLSRVQGHSDTGKTTFTNAVFKWCQDNNTLAVIQDTEGNFSFHHAQESGVKIDWREGEEGELIPDGDFIYVNNIAIWQQVGKARAKANGNKRSVTTIEDLAHFSYDIANKQRDGIIPMNVCFIWDALGTLSCDQSVEGKSYNAMWDAGAVKINFRDLWFQYIPNSRMVDSPYDLTMVVVAKIRHDMTTGGMGSTELQGGKVLVQASRLGFQLGNSMSAGIKFMTATFDKITTRWGNLVKIKVVKNHVEGASFEGEIISTPHGFIANTDEAKEAYKKLYKKKILKKLELSEDEDVELEYGEEDVLLAK